MNQTEILELLTKACEEWRSQGNSVFAGITSWGSIKRGRCPLAIIANSDFSSDILKNLPSILGVEKDWLQGFAEGYDNLPLNKESSSILLQGYEIGTLFRKQCPPDRDFKRIL